MGIEVVSLCIGLFGFSEILIQSEKKIHDEIKQIKTITMTIRSYLKEEFKFREAIHHLPLIIQSSIIGVIIGILPGIGSETSCWMAYTTGKKRSKNPEQWGTGIIEGVIAPETANNIECGTALIPLLTFGIPGDAISAMMLGAFVAQGLRPGPELFTIHYDIILALFITMYFATIAMYILGHSFIFFFARILNMKRSILYSIVFFFCVAGTFSIKNNLMDVVTMILSGFLGYGFRKFGLPLAPVAIGFILGGMLEISFRQAIIMGFGNPFIFFLRPISASFLIVTLALLAYFIWGQFIKKGKGIKKVTA
jgi:putative tricarboxylic transport membrane protein